MAETQLDIPALLDIKDMLESEKLDKRSILTYLSQYYHKFSKDSPTTECVNKTNAGKSVTTSETTTQTKVPVARSISTPSFSSSKPPDLLNKPAVESGNMELNTSLAYTLNYRPSNVSNCNTSAGQTNTEHNKDVCANNKGKGVEAPVSPRTTTAADKTKYFHQPTRGSVTQNIDAIKSLVFDNKTEISSSTTSSVMTLRNSSSSEERESDSGLGQSSSSSSSSSRLSSVSPSFNKTDLSQESPDKSSDKSLMLRKQGANLIIKPKRTHIITNNRINSQQNQKHSQGKRSSINKSFQEAIIKFNSLSMQTDAESDNAAAIEWSSLYQDVSKNVSKPANN